VADDPATVHTPTIGHVFLLATAEHLHMVDTEKIRTLAPHYVVMLVTVFLVVNILRALIGVRLVVEFAVILVIVFLYPFAVRRLGYAPSVWE